MQPKPQFGGTVTPPADLMRSARLSMPADQFDVFIAKYGEKFTPQQLSDFVTEMRYGPRN